VSGFGLAGRSLRRYRLAVIEEMVARVESGDDAVIEELADRAAADPVALAPYLFLHTECALAAVTYQQS
jgi:hypothetical protein